MPRVVYGFTLRNLPSDAQVTNLVQRDIYAAYARIGQPINFRVVARINRRATPSGPYAQIRFFVDKATRTPIYLFEINQWAFKLAPQELTKIIRHELTHAIYAPPTRAETMAALRGRPRFTRSGHTRHSRQFDAFGDRLWGGRQYWYTGLEEPEGEEEMFAYWEKAQAILSKRYKKVRWPSY